MKVTLHILLASSIACIAAGCHSLHDRSVGGSAASALFRKAPGVKTRWASFENPKGEKGAGGMENDGAKGHAFDSLNRGVTRVLAEVRGPGTIRRIWMTLKPKDPVTLRALRIDMYWDGHDRPAVSAPLGDFFCCTLGQMKAFENALFSSPEGRSLVCTVPMPFRTAAKITVTNESERDLSHLFYEVDYTTGDEHGDDVLYFHASWRRERPTKLGEDFEILPKVKGSGRFLGCNIGIIARKENLGWWGEGGVKAYIDGDGRWPTLAGTGTEDYVGTAWGQGVYEHRYQGSMLTDVKRGYYSFYRYHIPDPVYFDADCRVTIQQIGGSQKKDIVKMLADGVPIIPISCDADGEFTKLYERGVEKAKEVESLPDGWINYYRQDDVSAIAYFYLDAPTNNLTPLARVAERTAAIQ